jgi:hypothetical protein
VGIETSAADLGPPASRKKNCCTHRKAFDSNTYAFLRFITAVPQALTTYFRAKVVVVPLERFAQVAHSGRVKVGEIAVFGHRPPARAQ